MASSDLSNSEVKRLAALNQALSEELAQCQADKEFVWSLWKRLQVSKPDVSQAIGLVVQREKEKAEMKDRKILEILHAKDDRIAELEKLLSRQDTKMQEEVERERKYDDRKEELAIVQAQLVEVKQTSERKMKDYEEKMERLVDEKTKDLDKMKNENKGLKEHCEELEKAVESSRSELVKMKTLSDQYEGKIHELQKGLEDVIEKAQAASHEVDKKTESLARAKNKLQEIQSELKTSDHNLQNTRSAYQELKAQHDQAIRQASQQAKLIQQLQSLQTDTQKVIKNQESAHTMEFASLKKMYDEVLVHNEKLVKSNNELRHQLAELESQSVKPSVRHVSLQVNFDRVRVQRSRSKSRETEVQRMKDGAASDTRVETRHLNDHEDEVEDAAADRATSTPVKHTARRARSLSPIGSREPMPGIQHTTRTHSQIQVTTGHGRISEFLDISERRGRDARKQDDLRKLLRLKNQEVDELRKAHSRRLERLKSLQSAYDIVKEQIKTYEQHESDKDKKKKVPKTNAKELRREDSEGVWNELSHYKQLSSNLMQEKMNLEEEVDTLRVQAAVDASTIEELTKCLEDERHGLEGQLERLQAANKREEREKSRAEDLFEKNKKLQKSLQLLQNKESLWHEERDQLERKLRTLKADLVQAKTSETHHAYEHQALLAEVSKMRLKLQGLSRRMNVRDHPDKDRSRRELEENDTSGIHIVVHKRMEGSEEDRQSSSDEEDIFHSTPKKHPTRRSRSLSPSKSSPKYRSRSKSESRHLSTSRSRTQSRLDGSRSRSFGGSSPSKRELVSVLHHLDRMARAYQDSPPVFRALLRSVSTQTERVLYAESGMMTESGDSSSEASQSSEEATVSDIQQLSPIASRKDMATSPIKAMNQASINFSRKTSKSRGLGPASGNVALLKQRLGALQQQVTSLQEQRQTLQKAAVDQKQRAEVVQADLNLANARQHNSKITVQRLSRELEEAKRERDELQEEKERLIGEQPEKHSESEWRNAEARVKSQASEIVRQGSTIKALKAEGEEKNKTIRTLEEKIEHFDRDITQKRALIKDLRARAKSADNHDKIHAEAVETLEGRIASLNETLDQRKVEMDSLRKRVAVVTKEKHHYEQLSRDLQTTLDKKSAILKDTLSKLSEAEGALSDIEETATQQLQALASQSEKALDAAHGKIKQLQERINDLESFIKELAIDIASEEEKAADIKRQVKDVSTPSPSKDESMLRAQSIASSILNMSTKDLELFMDVDRAEEHANLAKEKSARKAQTSEWRKQIEAALASKKLPRKHLRDLIMKGWRRRELNLASREAS